MRYKLIHIKTKEETICDKVTIDGFDYYVSDEKEQVVLGRFYYEHDNHVPIYSFTECTLPEQYYLPQVIATTNPNIDDIPKVVDEVEKLANEFGYHDQTSDTLFREGLILGYNKSQETHSFSEEDMIEFLEWKTNNLFFIVTSFSKDIRWKSNNRFYDKTYTTKELLQLWKKQQPKTLYYE